MKILFRADGSSTMGLGHIFRCLAMVEMISGEFECVFCTRSPTELVRNLILEICPRLIALPDNDEKIFFDETKPGDIVVLDGYHFNTAYQQKVKAAHAKLIYIDDLPLYPLLADIVINHSPNAAQLKYNVAPGCKCCFGLNYVLLRREFLEQAGMKKTAENIDHIFINMGGADEFNLSLKFIRICLQSGRIRKIVVVLGAANLHRNEVMGIAKEHSDRVEVHHNVDPTRLLQLMSSCGLALAPASTISIELCAIGIGLMSGLSADNQLNIFEGLLKEKMCLGLGDFKTIAESEVLLKLHSLIEQKQIVQDMINIQKRMIDGLSGQRILQEVHKLAQCN